MENYVYEKEYPMGKELDDVINSVSAEDVLELLARQRRFMQEHTYTVIPEAQQIFEELVQDCDQLAKAFYGKIRATINYSSFIAKIELWCDYLAFDPNEFMYVLQKLSFLSSSIQLTPLTTGPMHIEIEMPYFTAIPKEAEQG